MTDAARFAGAVEDEEHRRWYRFAEAGVDRVVQRDAGGADRDGGDQQYPGQPLVGLVIRRFLADYVRNPVNLLLLAVVPIVFVVAGAMADAAKLLGGPGGPAVETTTAGWAAAFLAGIGMYFQTATTREVDRWVVIAGLPATGWWPPGWSPG